MPTKGQRPFSQETIDSLGQRLAQYRLGGCHTGEAQAIMAAVRKTANQHKRNYSELWALVHANAYAIIDAAHCTK